MQRYSIRTALIGLLVAPLMVLAQGSEIYGPGLKLKPDPTKDAFVRLIFWNQIWARHIQNNPGTMVNGEEADRTMDVGIRRSRFLAFAQVHPRYRIIFHAGINNQTFINGGVPNGGVTGNGGTYTSGKKPGLFVHDAWNEYDVVAPGKREDGSAKPFSLTLGTGLHYFNGVSRMSSASTLNFLAVDAPIFNWYAIELGDQFARQFGFFAKGKLGKLDYRLAVNKPFATAINPTPSEQAAATDYNGLSRAAFAGYVMYQFMDQESNVLPFTVGSYLGTKKVFNIGIGSYNQAQGTRSRPIVDNDTLLKRHDINLYGVDIFADLPFGGEKNMAVTAYSVYYLYDFGPRYFRTVGIMNEGSPNPSFQGKPSSAGAGNARPLMGTGNIWYTQAGLLLPKGISGKMRLQPFVAYTMKDLEALAEPMGYVDAGMNILFDGHHAKLTLQYSDRPIVVDGKRERTLGEFILQAQIFL